MFLKRGRPDINPVIAFLSTRVKEPNGGDWVKLLKLLGFLKGTIKNVLTLDTDYAEELKWYVDAAFAVYNNTKSHTGATLTLGKGCVIRESTKQKVNSKSSTKAKLVAVDNKISKMIWTKKFLEHQGFNVKLNFIYQDNESTINLENNVIESS
eukprot:14747724-Ditylum_brightwellii.AAC.1